MKRAAVVALAMLSSIAMAFTGACGSFDEADTPSGPGPVVGGPDGGGGTDGSPSSDDASTSTDAGDSGGDGATFPRFCERKAGPSLKFCDDFEQGSLGTGWTDHETQNNGSGLLSLTGLDRSLDVKMPTTIGMQVSDYWYFGPLAVSATTVIGFTMNANGNIADDDAEVVQLYEYDPANRYLGVKISGGLLVLFLGSSAGSVEAIFGSVPTNRVRITLSLSGTKLTATRDDNGPTGQIAFDGGAVSFTPNVRLGVGLVYTTEASGGHIVIDDVLVEN